MYAFIAWQRQRFYRPPVIILDSGFLEQAGHSGGNSQQQNLPPAPTPPYTHTFVTMQPGRYETWLALRWSSFQSDLCLTFLKAPKLFISISVFPLTFGSMTNIHFSVKLICKYTSLMMHIIPMKLMLSSKAKFNIYLKIEILHSYIFCAHQS